MKLGYDDRLGIPAVRGVPIGIYRDQMGDLAGGKTLAFFHQQVLPIEPLSDPSLCDLPVNGSNYIISAFSVLSVVGKSRVIRVFRRRRDPCQEYLVDPVNPV